MPKNPKHIEAPQALTAPQVAAMLGIDRSSLYRWLDRGIFPKPNIKHGRTVRWSRRAVERFIETGQAVEDAATV